MINFLGMFGFGQFLGMFGQETDELSSENVEESEFIENTEIINFGVSDLVNNQEVTDYLRDEIPTSHLENSPSIEYSSETYPDSSDVVGTFDWKTDKICIYGSTEIIETKDDILDRVTYEIGYNVYANIMRNNSDTNKEIAEQWEKLHEDNIGNYPYTDDIYEDFAETYMNYVRDPDQLIIFNSDKYEFMRTQVFAGRIYDSFLQLRDLNSARLEDTYYRVRSHTWHEAGDSYQRPADEVDGASDDSDDGGGGDGGGGDGGD